MAYGEAGLETSRREVWDLGAAWLALTLAVAFLFTQPVNNPSALTPRVFFPVFGVSFVTAGAGFLLHELAHKVVAQRLGYWAEFRASYDWLVIAVVSGLVGFLFAAPGAVQIRGRGLTERESGVIALAGPLTNLGLFALFLAASVGGGFVGYVAGFGMFINAFLAAFNLLPFGPLDGAKVLGWSKPVFAAAFLVSVGLVAYTFGFVELAASTLGFIGF